MGNFFDSSISKLGTPVSTSNPNYQNQLGFDAGLLDVAPGVVHNGDTSATIDLSTTQDRYLPGVVYFRTDIYAPEMVLHKTVTDVNGGDVNPGDVLQYDISSTNTGQSSAYDSRINDAIPANTAYLPGSLSIVSSPGGIAGTKTDPTDLDQAEFDAGTNQVRFRIGTGATALNAGDPVHNPDGGGVIAPNESFSVRFSVVVGANVPDGTQILNTAVLSSKDENGIDFTSVASAPAAVAVRGVPDVTIDKSHTGTFVRGRQGTFSLLVSNVGGRATSGPVVIDDTLPDRPRRRQRGGHRLGVLGGHDRQLAALRPLRLARGGRGISARQRRRQRARERARHDHQHRHHRWRQRDQHVQQHRQRHGGGDLCCRRRDRQVGDAHHDAARQERHLHDGRHEQWPLERAERQGGRPAPVRHDVRVRDAGRVRAGRHDRALLAGHAGQGPERDDHPRLGHPALPGRQDEDERGERDLDDARLRPQQQQGQRHGHDHGRAAVQAAGAQVGRRRWASC